MSDGGRVSPPSGDAGVLGSGTGNSDRTGDEAKGGKRADRPAPEVLSAARLSEEREIVLRGLKPSLPQDQQYWMGRLLAYMTSHEALRRERDEARREARVEAKRAVIFEATIEEMVARRDRLLEAARAAEMILSYQLNPDGLGPDIQPERVREARDTLRGALVEEHDGDG